MRVEQAIYGEIRGGHSLRQAGGDPRLAADLAPRLDLPDTAPPGVDWSPFVSGFPFRDCYVLARTFKDLNAGRSGMVFAHALIAPLEAVADAADLSPIFARLATTADAPADLANLTINLKLEVGPRVLTPALGAELEAAAALLSQREAGPVVRRGHDDFEGLVLELWRSLPPSLRRTFAFRLSFGPNDLTESPGPALVCTPTTLLGRWHGYRVINPSLALALSPAAKLLSSAPGGDGFGRFVEEIGAEPSTFAALALLSEAYRLASADGSTLSDLVAAMRLVGPLSPDPLRGVAGKAALIERAVSAVGHATAAEVLLLRNLDLTSFATSKGFWAALASWVVRNPFSPVEDLDFEMLFGAFIDPQGAVEAWRGAVADGLFGAGQTKTVPVGAALCRLAETDDTKVPAVWAALQLKAAQEEAFIRQVPPTLQADAAATLAHLAAAAGLVRFHGLLVSLAFDTAEAVSRQLAIEPAPSMSGLRLALRAASPADLVSIAIQMQDDRLIAVAAEAAAATPSLLRDLDFSHPASQSLWHETLAKNAAAWNAPSRPTAAFEYILDDVLASRPVAKALSELLAATPLANVVGYKRRAAVWAHLSAAAKAKMLQATAKAWIEQFPDTEAPEPPLEMAILAHPELDILLSRLSRENPAAAVQRIEALPEFGEARFAVWLQSALTSGQALNPSDAESIGHLINERGWRSVADALLKALAQFGRNDVRPALRASLRLVGFWDVWFNNLSPIGADEKWEGFERLASDLFPNGPDEYGLWDRAGGHNADLIVQGTGRARWHDALQRIRRGARAPKMSKLLKEMRAEFPGNSALGLYMKDEEFGG